MPLAKNFYLWEVSTNSYRLTELFAETMRKRQISLADWYELITAPLDDSFSAEEQDIVTRLMYGVRHGLIRIVEKR